ncbi:MAG TPA: hypothetical protein VEX62_00620 [Candidatus Limnocylindrales bacterium]|nr:hypothetical protein [Candidatus Limnocylindrales bacterium]
MDQPPTQPVTTRIGGGSSARIAVGVLAGVLGVVAWVGFSNRPNTPPVAPITAAPVAAATNTQAPSSAPASPVIVEPTSPSPATPRPSRAPSPTPEPILGAITFGQDAFAAIAFVDGRMYIDVLQEIEPGRFRGSFRVPFPSRPGGHRILLSQLWTRDRDRDSYVELGEWPLRLDPLVAESEAGGAVLQDGIDAQPNERNVPRAIKRGFNVTVYAQSNVSHGVVSVEMIFGPRVGR